MWFRGERDRKEEELRCYQNAWGFQTDAALQSDGHTAITAITHLSEKDQSVFVVYVWRFVSEKICVYSCVCDGVYLCPYPSWKACSHSTRNNTCMSKSVLKWQHWFKFCWLSPFCPFSLHRNTSVSHFSPSHTHTHTHKGAANVISWNPGCHTTFLSCFFFFEIVSFSLGS